MILSVIFHWMHYVHLCQFPEYVPVMLPIHAYQSTMLENAREKRMEPDGMELDI
jgi:hypothetical protein